MLLPLHCVQRNKKPYVTSIYLFTQYTDDCVTFDLAAEKLIHVVLDGVFCLPFLLFFAFLP